MAAPTGDYPRKSPGRAPARRLNPRRPQLWLDLDDGTSIAVRGRGVVGREPEVETQAAHVVTLADKKQAVSRTHLEFDVDTSGLWVRDLGSTNGTAITVEGQRTSLEPGQAVPAPPGATIDLAGRQLHVRAMDGRAVIGSATVDWGVATHIGPKHRQNEDSYAAQAPVFMVADGMGGHAAGDVASQETIDALVPLAGDTHARPESLAACLADARARIGAIPTDGGPPPGATLSGVIVTHDEHDVPSWMVVNIGDSRTYRLTADGLAQLTVDHNVAEQLISRDSVRFASARSWRYGSRLTKAVVAATDHEPDISLLPVNVGDRVLTCSDGLTDVLDNRSIGALLGGIADPLAAAQALVNAAVRAGVRDDVTALVVDAVALASDRESSRPARVRAVG